MLGCEMSQQGSNVTDFIDDLLKEAPEEGLLPTPSSGAEGEGGTVERAGPDASVPVPFSPGPAATLARRTIGIAKSKKKGFKFLTQRHKLIIGLHLNGKSSKHIADVVGCSVAAVNSVIRDPLAQEVITYYYEGVESELKALFPAVVDTVRDALADNAIGTRLKGVDRFAKLTGMDGGGEEKKGVTVQVVTDARVKIVQEIRAAREKVVEIEMTPVDVEAIPMEENDA